MLGFWVLGHMSFGGTQFSTCVTLMRPFLSAVTVAVLVAQLRLTLCHPMDCSPLGFSVHGGSPGKNTGVGCHSLLQEIFPTQGLNPGLPYCRHLDSLPSEPPGNQITIKNTKEEESPDRLKQSHSPSFQRCDSAHLSRVCVSAF